MTCHWIKSPAYASILVFLQVFFLWALHFISEEIENPFGSDANDLDGQQMQDEFDRHLLLLIGSSNLHVPTLGVQIHQVTPHDDCSGRQYPRCSLLDVWSLVQGIEIAESSMYVMSARRTLRRSKSSKRSRKTMGGRRSTREFQSDASSRFDNVLRAPSPSPSAAWSRDPQNSFLNLSWGAGEPGLHHGPARVKPNMSASVCDSSLVDTCAGVGQHSLHNAPTLLGQDSSEAPGN